MKDNGNIPLLEGSTLATEGGYRRWATRPVWEGLEWAGLELPWLPDEIESISDLVILLAVSTNELRGNSSNYVTIATTDHTH